MQPAAGYAGEWCQRPACHRSRAHSNPAGESRGLACDNECNKCNASAQWSGASAQLPICPEYRVALQGRRAMEGEHAAGACKYTGERTMSVPSLPSVQNTAQPLLPGPPLTPCLPTPPRSPPAHPHSPPPHPVTSPHLLGEISAPLASLRRRDHVRAVDDQQARLAAHPLGHL